MGLAGITGIIMLAIVITISVIVIGLIVVQWNDAVSSNDVTRGPSSNVETNPYVMPFMFMFIPGLLLFTIFKDRIKEWIKSKI